MNYLRLSDHLPCRSKKSRLLFQAAQSNQVGIHICGQRPHVGQHSRSTDVTQTWQNGSAVRSETDILSADVLPVTGCSLALISQLGLTLNLLGL